MATCHWLAHVAKCIPIFSKVCSPFHSKFPNLPSINIRVNKMIRLFFPTFIKKIKDFSVKTYKTHWQTFHVSNRTFHEKTVFENNSKTKTLKILYILASFFFFFLHNQTNTRNFVRRDEFFDFGTHQMFSTFSILDYYACYDLKAVWNLGYVLFL